MDGIDSDALKINYYTPVINGFQFAASYTPDTSDTSGDSGLYNDIGDGTATAFGIKYSGKMGGMKVKASYGVNELDEDTGVAEAEDEAFGLSVSSGPLPLAVTSKLWNVQQSKLIFCTMALSTS